MKFWNKDDFQVNSHFLDFMKDRPNIVETWKQTQMKYNEIGFRGDSLNENGFKVMTVGCSHTEGCCVNDDETWPFYLAKEMGWLHYNCSIGGSSNDYIARTILTFTDVIKPNLVIVMYTAIERMEYYKKNKIYPFAPNPWGYFTDVDEGIEDFKNIVLSKTVKNDEINWYKNHLLITYFLKSKNIPFIWNPGFSRMSLLEKNKYSEDYTNFIGYTYDKVHANAEHNREFAKKFSNFLKKNKDLYFSGII